MFHIVKEDPRPVHLQLEEQIHLSIHSGRLSPGSRLPAVRILARQLRLNVNTVARVYRDLQQRGFLVLERGAGTFVAQEPPEAPLERLEFDAIRNQAKHLINLCLKAGLSFPEFSQLTAEIWKESEYEG